MYKTGYCQILLKNGDLLDGKFLKDRLLQGMATIEGKNMDKHGLSSIRGFHKSGILHGQGRAVIAPNALWSHIKCEVILEGIFNDGYLEGPVRGLDTFGNLIFVGFYDKGLPRGSCWVCKIFIKLTVYGPKTVPTFFMYFVGFSDKIAHLA